MTLAPVTPERIARATRFGLMNVGPAAIACRKAGLPFYAACALLEKESGGRNVYGHDAGGALSGYPGTVDASNFDVFRWLVFDKGQTSNGVGPCQLTWKGFFIDMEAKGLKPYDIADNMLYGFGLLAGYYAASKSWEAAGARYNGSPAYGKDFAVKVRTWHTRLSV